MQKPLFRNGDDWSFPMLENFDNLGQKYIKELGFTHFPLQIEIVSPEQMLGLYSSHAMPINYSHWSFGEGYLQDYKAYYAGKKGLAYEICKNTNPCLCYNMETNSAIEQASVIFHVYGHSAHFASNYLYRNNSDSNYLILYMDYARTFIKKCEEKYGVNKVEHVLDLCHALQYSSFDKHKRSSSDIHQKMLERELYNINHQDYMSRKLNNNAQPVVLDADDTISDGCKLPEENLLYFIEKNSPVLTNWQREICRIIRQLAQFSYQNITGQSQIMAEGTAMFTECYMMLRAHEDGYIDEGSYLEYLNMNSWVLYQQEIHKKIKDPFNAMQHGKLNPYFLGLHMMRDIRRMCENPTAEDIKFNPDICHTDWKLTLSEAISDYRDESFIRQFLSPCLIRRLKLMHSVYDNENPGEYLVKAHAEMYDNIRNALADLNTVGNYIPNIEIESYEGDFMQLRYYPIHDRQLDEQDGLDTLDCISELMGCEVDINFK